MTDEVQNDKLQKMIDDITKVALQVDPDFDPEHSGILSLEISELRDELKSWKDRLKEKKDTDRSVKKRSSDVRDFLVKLQRVFKDDCYIYNARYILPGKSSSAGLKGTFLLEVGDAFSKVVEDICSRNLQGVLYIEDIDLLKKLIDDGADVDPYERIKSGIKDIAEDSEVFINVKNTITSILDEIHEDMDQLVTIPPQNDPEIYSIKKIFQLQYGDCKPVEMNLELIPTITEGGLEDVEYCCGADNKHRGAVDLYYIRLKIPFNYFTIFVKYYYF